MIFTLACLILKGQICFPGQHRRSRSLLVFPVLIALTFPIEISAQVKIDVDKFSGILNQELIKDVNLESESDLIWLDLRSVYLKRNYRPIWFGENGLNTRASVWLNTIRSAEQEALVPEDYFLSFFERHWNDASMTQQVWIELLLSKALYLYIHHMYRGRLHPEDMGLAWHINKARTDTAELMQSVINANDFETSLVQLQPPHATYHRLQKSLHRYRKIADAGGWTTFPESVNLRIGNRHALVPLLRQRLSIEDDLLPEPVNGSTQFDQPLKHAVERFQLRHGINIDGIVGPETRFEMNVPVERRIEQIALNMERWRWLPRDLGKRYILTNIAGYELIVYENNQALFILPVIAGTPQRPTPVVAGTIQSIVLNPYWYIPTKIAIKDLIPRQQRNPRFLKSMGIRVFSHRGGISKELDHTQVDWSRVTASNIFFTLRQDPGPKNSLGRIKIKFDNDFALYLHDTPKQKLFTRAVRAFSSGCIRVENALDLAFYLLKGQNNWSKEKISETIVSNKTQTINVADSIPVYLVYWTVWAGTDNAVYFRKDIYGWDQIHRQCL